eukprot:TRINITY_DN6739_c0_g4_i1.p1 TRINITY_DN6739_c0_g4~~TRINITY_DN6739_c0_g4_i1.p1  ORF type:complete len:161 (+),score=12.05 TRINITY_DN6739_c0_g4_i1:288-770(+)
MPMPMPNHPPPHLQYRPLPNLPTSSIHLLHLQPLLNITELPKGFLSGSSGLASVNLGSLPHLLLEGLMAGCTGLTTVDLQPLSQFAELPERFLANCMGLTSIDMQPLSHLPRLPLGFLTGCTGLTSLDLSQFVKISKLPKGFLRSTSMGGTVVLPPHLRH